MGVRMRIAAVLAGWFASGALSAASAQIGTFMRVVEDDDGLRPRLEAAIRAYSPVSGEGPTIFLAAAVHVGDQSFYHGLQEFLDAQDLVLFEGVGGPGAGNDPRWQAGWSPEVRAEVSRSRARLLCTLIQEHAEREGGYPKTLLDVREAAGDDGRLMVEMALLDAWSRPYVYGVVTSPAGTAVPYVMSLGADGALDGEGAGADIVVSPVYAPEPQEPGSAGEGIQQQLADALGLEFQLAAMSHEGPNWRNSDMSVEQLMERLESAGFTGEGEGLFDLLSGRGIMGRLAGFGLRLLSLSPRLREMTKAMLVTMLAQADELMAAQVGGMADLMQILLEDRNQVVIEDLRRVLASHDGLRSVAIIYGAGHLPGIERVLVEDLGYRESGVRWHTAIQADLERVGVSTGEAKMFRSMIERSLDRERQKQERRSR